jgi:small subunit ribosomal protein S17
VRLDVVEKESEGMSGQKKTLVGRVVSDKMDKTVVVRVDRLHRHRLYKKVIKATKKYKAHDEENACGMGDIVRIAESRPISREKRWVVQEILEKAG